MANTVKKQPTQPRFFQKTQEIHCDTFKLEVAKMKKNLALLGAADDIVNIEHCHFFRTYNSDGKKETHCHPVGGHTHEVVYKEVEGGVAEIVSISGPVSIVTKVVKGKRQKISQPMNADIEDFHTHDITYHGSSSVMKRQPDPRAAQMQGEEATKVPKQIPGIVPNA